MSIKVMTNPIPSDRDAEILANAAMNQIWNEWFSFHERHFRAPNLRISMADQIAFYEIAQPILRRLAAKPVDDGVRDLLLAALIDHDERKMLESNYREPSWVAKAREVIIHHEGGRDGLPVVDQSPLHALKRQSDAKLYGEPPSPYPSPKP